MKLSSRLTILIRSVAAPAIGLGAVAQAAHAQAAVDYTRADVDFMQGMIHHHAQALVMADMATTHGGSSRLVLFCKKVTNSQQAEITAMQRWLKDRNQAAPDPKDPHFSDMPGMPGMKMTMPGMLTDDQMKQLDQARDTTWDRLFLTFMIQHHQGALKMVTDLTNSPGGGQQADLFRFASDVYADQSAEIGRMQLMLNTSSGSKPQ